MFVPRNPIFGINGYRKHSALDSIMRMFTNAGGATTTAAPVPGQQTPAQASQQQPTTSITAQGDKTAPNGAVPVDANTGKKTEPTEKPPLDAFKDLWQTPEPKKDANGNVIPNPADQSILNIDPNKIMEAAKKIDFSKTVDAAVMERVAKGGEDGAKAFLEALNAVGQASYGQGLTISSTLTQKALDKAKENFIAQIPEIVKRVNAQDSLRAEDARFQNPAAKPLIDMIQNQIAIKHPDATAAERNALAKSYLSEFASNFTVPPATEPSKQAKVQRGNEIDWNKLMFGE